MNPRIISANLVVKLMSFYREKTTMFFTSAFPIILILVFGTIFMSQDNVEYHLCVQDLDQTNSSAQAIKALELNGKFKITRVDPAISATLSARAGSDFVVAWENFGLGASYSDVLGRQWRTPYFADGFEAGDACAWSAAVGGGCP